jgi:hypothetical protein
MKKTFLLFICLIALQQLGEAQSVSSLADPRRNIDTAVNLMSQEKYEAADAFFMRALGQIEVLSADFCYHFGKNSLLLEKHRQSIDWLNKYLELKGSQGQYSKEVFVLLEKAEDGFREDRSEASKADVETKFFYKNSVKCETGKHVICPVCKGDDVIITLDQLREKRYKSCPYSSGGYLTCQDFNLLIQGKLKAKN